MAEVANFEILVLLHEFLIVFVDFLSHDRHHFEGFLVTLVLLLALVPAFVLLLFGFQILSENLQVSIELGPKLPPAD